METSRTLNHQIIMKYILFAYGTFLSLLLQSCNLKHPSETLASIPIKYKSPNKMYKRDSLYIAYTIQQFNKLSVVGYGVPERNFLSISIDTIIYSPDTLKLFSLIITYRRDDNNDTLKYYDGDPIIGYRLKTADSWIIYPVTMTVFVGYENYNMVRDRLRKAYFQNFGLPVSGIWNYRTKKFETRPSYNVVDHRFWDSSFIWQKDVSIAGYYTFQFHGNGTSEDQILKMPNINYPDSLLNQYHKN